MNSPASAALKIESSRDAAFMFALPMTLILIIWWIFSPGFTNRDTLDMLMQSRAQQINDWHSPLVAGIWAMFPSASVALSTTFFLVLMSIVLSAVCIARSCGLTPLAAGLIASLVMITPPVLAGVVCVCKDTLVGALFCPTVYFSILARSGTSFGFWSITRNLLLALGALVRPDFMVIGILLVVFDALFRRSRSWVVAGGHIIIVLAFFFVLHAAIFAWKNVSRRHPVQYILISDLVDLSVYSNEMLIPEPFANGQTVNWLKQNYQDEDATECFWPKVDPNPQGPHIAISFNQTDFESLRQKWLTAAGAHPLELIWHRLRIFYRYTLRDGACYYQSGVDENSLGIKTSHPMAVAWGVSYLAVFRHDILHRHIVTIILAPFLIVYLWRRQNDASRGLATALICGTLYQLEIPALGSAPAYRFGTLALILFWIALYIVCWQIVGSRLIKAKA